MCAHNQPPNKGHKTSYRTQVQRTPRQERVQHGCCSILLHRSYRWVWRVRLGAMRCERLSHCKVYSLRVHGGVMLTSGNTTSLSSGSKTSLSRYCRILTDTPLLQCLRKTSNFRYCSVSMCTQCAISSPHTPRPLPTVNAPTLPRWGRWRDSPVVTAPRRRAHGARASD